MSQIAILEGYRVPRRRRRRRRGYADLGRHRRRRRVRRYGALGAHRRGRSGQRTKFAKAAKACSRVVRSRGGSFRACMRRKLKRGR
jgi:hypothetical protein